MSKIQYNCACCGKKMSEEERLEAELIEKKSKLLKSKLILDIINTVLKVAILILVIYNFPYILKFIDVLSA